MKDNNDDLMGVDEIEDALSGKFDSLDELTKLLKSKMKNGVVLAKNKDRYDEVQVAIQDISDVVWAECPDADIKVDTDPIVGTGIDMTIKNVIITICDTKKFSKAIMVADSMGVDSLTDGRVEIGIAFHSVFDLVPPLK